MVKLPEQPSLLPDEAEAAVVQDTLDTAAIAAAGERRDYDPNERHVSEAAVDQGWGPVDLPPSTAPDQTPANQKLFELPGKNGRNNWYNQPSLRPHEAQRGMSDKEIDAQADVNARGAAAARVALKAAQKK